MATKQKQSTSTANPLLDGISEDAVRGQGARWAHDDAKPGAGILGRFVGTKPITYKDGKQGEALVFSPAVELTGDGELIVHRSIETINSAVLAQKITPETDQGVVFAVVYVGREKSAHSGRSEFKQFTVAESTPDRLRQMLQDNGGGEYIKMLPA